MSARETVGHSSQRAHSAVSHEHVKAGIVHWSLFVVEHDTSPAMAGLLTWERGLSSQPGHDFQGDLVGEAKSQPELCAEDCDEHHTCAGNHQVRLLVARARHPIEARTNVCLRREWCVLATSGGGGGGEAVAEFLVKVLKVFSLDRVQQRFVDQIIRLCTSL